MAETFNEAEMAKVLGKRQRESSDITTINPRLPPQPEQEIKLTTETQTALNLVETIDLSLSSPPASEKDESMIVEEEPLYISSNTVSRSSSPIEYGSGDEEEVGSYCCIELTVVSY